MNRKLFWKLCLSISLITMALVYLVSELSLKIENQMSYLGETEKSVLQGYRDEADQLLSSGDRDALYNWLEAVQSKEGTFATVIEVSISEVVPVGHADYRPVEARVGRLLSYPLHLHHENPLIEMPLSDGRHSLVIRVPDHMMPGSLWPTTHLLLHMALPLILMVLFSFVLYRHLMRPLGKLELATRQFSQGNYAARVSPELNGRSDELGRLALTFDEMATRVGTLVESQRHLLHDLSHELRTPLQRIELCLEIDKTSHYSRLKKETRQMRKLVEDTLTLAWLQNESPELRNETVDLVGLLEAIADDTQFEYPDRHLRLSLPDELLIADSSEKALNMALENIIRNAMRHSPEGGTVEISVALHDQFCEVVVTDQGEGVPDDCLDKIFKPFFRVDKSRDRGAGGFGLGLALAKRQLEGVAGSVRAENNTRQGLRMLINLPVSA
ncbi:MAG: sensor histidine kinase [Amphritea sp.]|nr:sensor histidine kinase [Amphritea sp.]